MRLPVKLSYFAIPLAVAAGFFLLSAQDFRQDLWLLQVRARDARGGLAAGAQHVDVPDPSGPTYRAYLQLRRVVAQHYVDGAKGGAAGKLKPHLVFLKTLLGSDFEYGLVEDPVSVTWTPPEDSQSQREPEMKRSHVPQRSLAVNFRGRRLLIPYGAGRTGSKPVEAIAGVLQWLTDVDRASGDLAFKELSNRYLSDLDPHSAFLDPDEFEELKGGTRGQFGGVGVVINDFQGLPFVREIVSNSPAQMAGIEPNDLLIRIGTERVRLDEIPSVLDRIRKQTSVGPVPIWLFRPRSGRMMKTFISREDIPTRSVERKFITGHPDVLHLRVIGFSSRTSQEIYDLYMDAVRVAKGSLKAVVLDLRGNPGGLLDQAIQVSDLFLASGSIVSTRSRYDNQTEQASEKQLIGLPLIVLVNSSSASASEIVAGALKDSGRALVIGERTFGKGSVQSLFELSGFGAIKLTIAHYFTPSGVSIQNTGIEPHVFVKLPQIKSHSVWVSGSSETEREEDLLHHLANPSGRTSADPQTFFEGTQGNWVWAHTSDDLSMVEGLGEISFTYPNYENSDQVTDLSRDAYVRIAIRFLEALERSRDGIWDVVRSFPEVLPAVRAAENAWLADQSRQRGASLLAGFFSGSVGDPKPSEPARFEVEFSGREELVFRSKRDDLPGQTDWSSVRLIGLKLPGAAEQPAVWFPVEALPTGLSRSARAEPSRSEVASLRAKVPRLFWTAVSSLAGRPRQAHVFVKSSPVEAARFAQTVRLPESVGEWGGALHGTKLTVLSGQGEQSSGGSSFHVVAEFEAPVGENEPCEIFIAPFLSRQYQVTPTRLVKTAAEGCTVARFELHSNAPPESEPEYGGLVALFVRDRAGLIVGRMPVIEVVGGKVKESLLQ